MSVNPEKVENKGLKRKKKRSANQMLKKYAHSRTQGKGGELDSESYKHMLYIMEVIRSEFPQMEDKESFADNILEETNGKEVDFARNQVASFVLETLISFGSYEAVHKFIEALTSSLRPMCSDRFASHVLQKAIIACTKRCLIENSDKTDDKSVGSKDKKFSSIALKLIKYILNNLEEFIWDSYANHIARTSIECLGGLVEFPTQGKKSKPDLDKRQKVTDEFTDLLTKNCYRIYSWPQFHEFGHDELTSGFLQSMLYSLKNLDTAMCNSVVTSIVDKCFTKNGEEDLSNVFENESSVRLLETCLMVCEEEQFLLIFNKFFSNKLIQLSLKKLSNFAVQKLLDFCPNKEIFENIYNELEAKIEEIIQTGHTGVISRLANACLRLKSKQGPFLNALMNILKCSETEEKQNLLVPLCASLRNYDQNKRIQEEKMQLHLHGSLILQAVLKFNKPIKVVNSLLTMETNSLITMFGDPKGSRILDAFMDSSFVGEKSREKMMRKLRGHWVELANSIHGSRCLDKMWEKSQEKDKTHIMNELAAAGESLRSTKTGKLIYTKFRVNVYMRNKTEWAELRGKEEKAKNLFSDIIN